MKRDSVFDVPCECDRCEEEKLYFTCKGCLGNTPYCQGQDDYYYEYCTSCWYQLTHDLTTVVIH